MRTLLWLYPGDHTAVLAANVACQITTVVTVAAIASHAVARRNAATRHAIWLCALLCVAPSPAVAWMTQGAGLALVQIPWSSAAALRGR